MKFSCEKYLLAQAIATASRCAASKSPMPALEGLLVDAGDDDVIITGYDLKKGVYTSFPADVAEAGAVVLDCRLFGDIVRSLPDGVVTVDMKSGLVTKITCGAADFSIMGTSREDYPELPAVDRQKAISIPQNILRDMISRTIFAVSDNEARPVYTGELFEAAPDCLTVVAVDGYRLAIRRERLPIPGEAGCSFIVPGSALADVEKLCGDTDEPAEITVGSKHVSFAIGNTVLIARRLEGEFLNYEKSLPKTFLTVAAVNTADLTRAVSRVALMIDAKVKNPLHLRVEDGFFDLRCRTGIGSAVDQCQADVTGDTGLLIGFNDRYLLDALKAAPSEVIRVALGNATSPALILPMDEADDSFTYMILPVRLRGDA